MCGYTKIIDRYESCPVDLLALHTIEANRRAPAGALQSNVLKRFPDLVAAHGFVAEQHEPEPA